MINHAAVILIGFLFVTTNAFAEVGPEPAEASSLSTAPAPNTWQLDLSSENYSVMKDIQDLGNQAPVTSVNSVGVIYNLRAQSALELRQYFEMASNKERLTGRAQLLHKDSTEISSLLFREFEVTPLTIAGSKAITLESRYYAPTDRASKENKENGLLRADAYAEWTTSPRWSLAFTLSPRVLLNSSGNPVASKGSDADYYGLYSSPAALYHFNDQVLSYYMYTWGMKSANAQRGTWEMDAGNLGYHEIGIQWKVGVVLINPCLISAVDQKGLDGQILSSGSRVLSSETNIYNMNIYATF